MPSKSITPAKKRRREFFERTSTARHHRRGNYDTTRRINRKVDATGKGIRFSAPVLGRRRGADFRKNDGHITVRPRIVMFSKHARKLYETVSYGAPLHPKQSFSAGTYDIYQGATEAAIHRVTRVAKIISDAKNKKKDEKGNTAGITCEARFIRAAAVVLRL